MKTFNFLFSILFILYSCSKADDSINSQSSLPSAATRTAGDGVYDALGYGYDITDEFLGESSTKLKVIDVDSFVKENKGRFDNPFIGIIDQRVSGGEDAQSFLKQIITDSNFHGSVAALGKQDESGFFSATVTTGFKSNTKYSYSTKYSFARAEVIKKQRQYLLNTDVQTLSKYLSPVFLEDLNKYSPDEIVKKYGTHVLTNITVGGLYTAYYKSAVIEESSHEEKTKIVSAGAKFNLKKIGLDANGSWSNTEITELNKKNMNWECYIKALGGSTSGTSYTISPNQETSISINLGNWTSSVDDTHSKLVKVDWNATYPIYDLISDPLKKEQIKSAVIKYIESHQLPPILQLLPLYEMYDPKQKDRFYVTSWDAVQFQISKYGNQYRSQLGYILEKSNPDTLPLYEMYDPKQKDRFYVTSWDAVQFQISNYGNQYRSQLGYIIPM